MTLEEFEAALDLHGPELTDWPEPQRLAAPAVLARHAEARAMLAVAEEVATLLATTRAGPTAADPTAAVPPAADPPAADQRVGVDRIVALATIHPQQRPAAPAFRLSRTGWRYAACVAVALTGFALGVADGLRQAAPLDPLIAVAFGPVDPFDAL